jgi:hypothetical protein
MDYCVACHLAELSGSEIADVLERHLRLSARTDGVGVRAADWCDRRGASSPAELARSGALGTALGALAAPMIAACVLNCFARLEGRVVDRIVATATRATALAAPKEPRAAAVGAAVARAAAVGGIEGGGAARDARGRTG